MSVKMVFGKNVRRLRNSCSMTQEGVALLMGTSKQYISNIETGKQWLSSDKIEKLCDIFAVSCDELFLTNEPLEGLDNMLWEEVQKMDESKKARLLARAFEINLR